MCGHTYGKEQFCIVVFWLLWRESPSEIGIFFLNILSWVLCCDSTYWLRVILSEGVVFVYHKFKYLLWEDLNTLNVSVAHH